MSEISWWERISHYLLGFIPLLFAIWLPAVPIWKFIGVQPNFFLLLLAQWAIYRPDLLRFEQLLFLSFINDGMYGYPLGFSALHWFISLACIYNQRRFFVSQSFTLIYLCFIGITLIDSLIFWAMLSYDKGIWLNWIKLFPSLLVTIGLYPLVSRISLFWQEEILK